MNLDLLRAGSFLSGLWLVALLSGFSASAQVYSLNALAYVDFALSAGSNFITNPFSKQNNAVSNLFGSLPGGSYLRVWDPATGDFGPTNIYTVSGWSIPSMAFVLPQGALMWVPSPAQISFSGELFQGAVTGRTFSAGSYVWGRIPTHGWIFCGSIDECPPSQPPDGTVLCKWDRAAQRCRNYTYFGPAGGWFDEMFNQVDVQLDTGEAGLFSVPESFSMPLAPNPSPPILPPGVPIAEPRHDGTNLNFIFNAPAGVDFVVLRCTNFTESNWETVYEGSGTGQPATVTVPGANGGMAFYRITAPDPATAPYLYNDFRSGDVFRFQFYAPRSGIYDVQRSIGLSSGIWVTIESVSAPAKSYTTATDTNAVGANGYYRLRLNP